MKLTDQIHLLRIDFEIPISPDRKMPRFVNVLILFGDHITLIDTGVKGSEKVIFDYIRSEGHDPDNIETVILSHAHPDHIGSAAKIRELTHCRILAHRMEQEWIENIDLQNEQRPVPGFYHLVDTPVKIDNFIADGQLLNAGKGLTIRFIVSPGHSKGSLNTLFIEDRILFTADSVPLKNDIPNYDNYPDLMRSLKTIRSNDQYDIMLTSWTPPVVKREEIDRLITEGEEYMRQIDAAVQSCYLLENDNHLENCRKTVEKLGLPAFLANPLVDKAFRSHFS
jgi:hydroxyacylglutathione hydrolase